MLFVLKLFVKQVRLCYNVKKEQIMEFIILALVGLFLIYAGILNIKGNLSLLHSYHRKRVKEEDKLAFGKLIGLGNIIIGASLIVVSPLLFFADYLTLNALKVTGFIIMGIGLAIGLGLSFYAMIKYNKGIF